MRRSISILALLVAVTAVLAAMFSGQATAVAQPDAQPDAQPVARADTPAARAGATHPPTRQVYVRPVTASGRPAPGWTVRREAGNVTCFGTAPSAVNPGIAGCYPTAAGVRACFKSARHTVLCVRDAQLKQLVRIRYSGSYPVVRAPRTPTPIDLVLADGRTCLQRVGGAWGAPAQHPQWVGFDTCDRKASVYGPSEGDGVNRTNPAWTVKLWRNGVDVKGRHLVTRAVTSVYYIGVAAD